MKSIAFRLFLITVLSGFAFSLFAAPKNKKYALVVKPGIKVVEVSEPKVGYSSSLPIPQTAKTNLNKWMMILVDFTSELKEIGDNEKALKEIHEQRNATLLKEGSKRQHWLDNVDVTVKCMFETMSGDIKQHIMFTNTTKLYSLRLNNSKHLVLFFLPPHIIDRYYIPHPTDEQMKRKSKEKVKDKDKDEPFRWNRLLPKNLPVEVVISADGVEYAREYLNVKLNEKESKRVDEVAKLDKKRPKDDIYFEAYKKKFSGLASGVPGNYNFLEGALLSKRESPWANYKFEQFDLEKPAR